MRKVICECGKEFEDKSNHRKYCSDECKNKFNDEKWGTNRKEFNKENPHLCSACGCDTSGSRWRYCLDCRIRHRAYSMKYRKRKLQLNKKTKSI